MISDLKIAPVRKRFLAFALDYFWISVYIVILASVSAGLIFFTESSLPQNPILWDVVSFLTLVFPVICYFAMQESSFQQATWGKQKAGIQVVNGSGARLSKAQAFMRALVKFLPWQIAHTSLFHIEGWPLNPEEPSGIVTAAMIVVWVLVGIYLGSLWIVKYRQTPYDRVSGAFVVVKD